MVRTGGAHAGADILGVRGSPADRIHFCPNLMSTPNSSSTTAPERGRPFLMANCGTLASILMRPPSPAGPFSALCQYQKVAQNVLDLAGPLACTGRQEGSLTESRSPGVHGRRRKRSHSDSGPCSHTLDVRACHHASCPRGSGSSAPSCGRRLSSCEYRNIKYARPGTRRKRRAGPGMSMSP